MKRLALIFCSCATLNTAGMTDHCRRLYDACLNACPSAPAPPPGPVINNTAPAQVDVARCTNDCNERARSCK